MEASQLPGGRRGDDVSQLWSLVLLLSVFFWGRRGPVSFRAVKGKGGESALELGVKLLLSVFVLGGAGGQSASSVWLAQRLTRVITGNKRCW